MTEINGGNCCNARWRKKLLCIATCSLLLIDWFVWRLVDRLTRSLSISFLRPISRWRLSRKPLVTWVVHSQSKSAEQSLPTGSIRYSSPFRSRANRSDPVAQNSSSSRIGKSWIFVLLSTWNDSLFLTCVCVCVWVLVFVREPVSACA